MADEPAAPPPEETKTPTGDLKKAQAAFWKAAAKLLGVLATALIPAVGVWIDADSKVKEAQAEAIRAQKAAATEKAQSEVAYAAQQDEIEDLKKGFDELTKIVKELGESDEDRGETLIRHEERINELRRRFGYSAEPVAIAGKPLTRPDPLLKALMDDTKKPPHPPAKARPKADPDRIEQIQKQYKEGAF